MLANQTSQSTLAATTRRPSRKAQRTSETKKASRHTSTQTRTQKPKSTKHCVLSLLSQTSRGQRGTKQSNWMMTETKFRSAERQENTSKHTQRDQEHHPKACLTSSVKGHRIASDMQTKSREAMHGESSAEHTTERNKWSRTTFDMVDWDAFKTVIKRLQNESKTRFIKHVHDWLPVGCQQQHIHKDRDPKCLTCQEDGTVEKTEHLFQCQNQKNKMQQVSSQHGNELD